MSIKKMALAWITVSDFQKSKEFFVDTLGLKISGGSEEWNWLELSGEEHAGAMLGMGGTCPESDKKTEVLPGHNAIVTMTVDDLLKTKIELEAKGVAFLGDIVEIPGHVKMAMFVDPDGNKFQLVQELDNCSA